jgi:hypothetical protein
VAELVIITSEEPENPSEVAEMVQAWTSEGKGNLAKIDVWIGAHGQLEYGDFHVSPSPGPERTGHTFVSCRAGMVWEHHVFSSMSQNTYMLNCEFQCHSSKLPH